MEEVHASATEALGFSFSHPIQYEQYKKFYKQSNTMPHLDLIQEIGVN